MNLVLAIFVNLIKIYSVALIIYILMSWFPNARGTSVGKFLAKICEPYLEQFRKFIPPLGMIDLSPIVALLVLNLAESGIYQLFRWII